VSAPHGDELTSHLDYRSDSIVRLGRTSLTYRTRLLRAPRDGVECAMLTGVAVHFDLRKRAAIELPAEFRARAEAMLERE
jgi:acyl-CoA thioesterase FadM